MPRILMLLTCLLVFSSVWAGDAVPAKGSGPAWVKDFDTAVKESRVSGKPVLLLMDEDGCQWCEKLLGETMPDSRVVESSKGFVCVRVHNPGLELRTRFNLSGYPCTRFVDRMGGVIGSVNGFEKAEDFLGEMRTAQGKAEASAKEFEEKIAAVEAAPEDVAKALDLALEEATRGLAAEAQKLLKQAQGKAKAAEREELAYTNAEVLRRLGRSAEALAAFEKFQESYPKSDRRFEATYRQGKLLAALNKVSAATKLLKVLAADAGAGEWSQKAASALKGLGAH